MPVASVRRAQLNPESSSYCHSTVEFSSVAVCDPALGVPFVLRTGDRARTCNRRVWNPLRFQLRHARMEL